MKKYIFPLLAFALLSTQSWGQTKPTEAQTELNAYMDDGLVTFKSQDGQYSFRVGGRLAVDGAYYIDTIQTAVQVPICLRPVYVSSPNWVVNLM